MTEFVTPERAAEAHFQDRERLPMWVVTRHPSDHPGLYVARMHLTLPQPVATDLAVVGVTLGKVRSLLPPGLFCLARDPADDPVIVETWI